MKIALSIYKWFLVTGTGAFSLVSMYYAIIKLDLLFLGMSFGAACIAYFVAVTKVTSAHLK